ncbi:MAG: chemotaxis protein CheW [Gemmatimonadota bacterium]
MPLPAVSQSYLVVQIGDTQIGLQADRVREIVRAVAISPAHGSPSVIEGVINLHGQIVPVVDVRQRLALDPALISPAQFLVVMAVLDRTIALRVDDVEDIVELSDVLAEPALLSPVLQRLAGVAAAEHGVLMIYDVDSFLTQTERDALDAAATVHG